MLLVGNAPKASSAVGAAEEEVANDDGVNNRSDVWSVGCLFFEVLTGEYLFQEKDWTSFYLRVTSRDLPLLTEPKVALLPSAHAQEAVAFLHFVLEREPALRPPVADVTRRFAALQAALTASEPAGVADERAADAHDELEMEDAADAFLAAQSVPPTAHSVPPTAPPKPSRLGSSLTPTPFGLKRLQSEPAVRLRQTTSEDALDVYSEPALRRAALLVAYRLSLLGPTTRILPHAVPAVAALSERLYLTTQLVPGRRAALTALRVERVILCAESTPQLAAIIAQLHEIPTLQVTDETGVIGVTV